MIDESGLRLDATALNQMLADKRASDPENALADLLDLNRYSGNLLLGSAPMLARNVPMKSRRWRDGDGCANEEWRVAA